MYPVRIILGLLCWAAGGWALWQWAQSAAQGRSAEAPSLRTYLTDVRREVVVRYPQVVLLAINDPVYYWPETGAPQRVGRVSALLKESRPLPERIAYVDQARVELYSFGPPTQPGSLLTHYVAPLSLASVAELLAPPEKRAAAVAELQAALLEHQQALVQALAPLVERSMHETLAIVQEDFPGVWQRRRPEIDALLQEYRVQIVDRELLPLVQAEVWPIAVEHGQPVATAIGRELWSRVSLWRFGWRFLYDRSPLPERNLAEREFQRFLAEEVQPVLQERTPEIAAAVEQIVADVADDPQVRLFVRGSLDRVLQDARVRRLIVQMLREVLVDNPRVRAALMQTWTGPDAERVLNFASSKLEPTIRRLTDKLLGTPQTGITPEFAEALRMQILQKDRRWLQLTPAAGTDAEPVAAFDVQVGGESPLNPFLAEHSASAHDSP